MFYLKCFFVFLLFCCSLRILFKLKSKLKLNKRFEVTPPPYAECDIFNDRVFIVVAKCKLKNSNNNKKSKSPTSKEKEWVRERESERGGSEEKRKGPYTVEK